jgi:hypothetical protein
MLLRAGGLSFSLQVERCHQRIKAWVILITNTCCTRHRLCLTVEGQEFPATVGRASLRVQPIPAEKKLNRTR